ncbi:hypothetical protein [Sulfurimonas sp.]|uniref:hypothetical protein n=1 Tax=Sulfurimonas sp. TaxID=2022749 RepID=UPI0025F4EE50|nr:hypothetical protein [Sulfurimonas sp.]
MIQGLANFTDYFKDNSDDYVVIGGLATAMIMNDFGFIARATKDIDLVVISKDNEFFLKKLLKFIDIAGYKTKERTDDDSKRNLFRFLDSDNKDYPEQIELFAIHEADSDILTASHIIKIDTPKYYKYLSAILLNTEYFNLLIKYTTNVDGLHVATPEALIPLKIHAHLNLLEDGDSDAKKHFTDVIRLATMLDEDDVVVLEGLPREEFMKFLPILEETHINTIRNIIKEARVGRVPKETILKLLKSVYSV